MILIKDTYGTTLQGAIDGANTTFLVRVEFIPESVNVYLNGLLKVREWDDGFTVTAPRTITMKEAPLAGDSLEIEYQAVTHSGGGALGGVPAPPVVVELRPLISDAHFKKECE